MSKIIVVDGLPGVGKSFFCNKLKTFITRDMTSPFLPYAGFVTIGRKCSDGEEDAYYDRDYDQEEWERDNSMVVVFPEQVDGELLDKYLLDPKVWAFEFQKKILLDKAKIYERAQTVKNSGGIAIIDRSIEGDRAMALSCYSRGYLTPSEWDEYSLEYGSIINRFKTTNIIHDIAIYLDDEDARIRLRILTRGNGNEYMAFTSEVIQNIRMFYDEVPKNSGIGGTSLTPIPWLHMHWPFNVKMVTSLL